MFLKNFLLLALLPAALACTDGTDCTCDLAGANCVCAANYAQSTG